MLFLYTQLSQIRKTVNVRQPLSGTVEWNCKFAKHFQEAIRQYWSRTLISIMPTGISFMGIAETSTKMYILGDIYYSITCKSQKLLTIYISNHWKISKLCYIQMKQK